MANVIFIQIHCRWHKKETNLQQTANYQHHKGRREREISQLQYIFRAILYLPCSCVIDTVPMEWLRSFSLDLLDSISRPRSIRVGGLGLGRFALSLLNIRMTVGMSGRSSAWSCTQSNAMWMHLRTCRTEHDALITGSISSAALSSFHCRHAWKCLWVNIKQPQYEYDPCLFRWVPSNYGYRTGNVLTYPAIFKESSWQWKLTALFPVMISKIRTPKP